jgi:hypothetical protein
VNVRRFMKFAVWRYGMVAVALTGAGWYCLGAGAPRVAWLCVYAGGLALVSAAICLDCLEGSGARGE